MLITGVVEQQPYANVAPKSPKGGLKYANTVAVLPGVSVSVPALIVCPIATV